MARRRCGSIRARPPPIESPSFQDPSIMNSLNQFLFGIYPYIALTVFLLLSLIHI